MKAVKKFSDNGVYFKMVEAPVPEIKKTQMSRYKLMLSEYVLQTFMYYMEQ
ncbi:MAG: hypothetical protein JWR18_1642 [Segetibacter sp.]|nr:hypothetical protein [Segetibacter sp.]